MVKNFEWQSNIVFIAAILLNLGSYLLAGQERNEETVIVTGKAAICFYPTRIEIDSLRAKDNNSGVDEVVGDFQYHTKAAFDSLKWLFKKQGIEIVYTANPRFKVKLKKNVLEFVRQDFEHIVGIILTDGRKTEMILGVYTSQDYISKMKRFFDEKQKE